MTPEINQSIAILRQKQQDGTLDIENPEDLAAIREAIQHMRGGRVSAAIASASSKSRKAPIIAPNADDMMNELEGL
jgi:hypothetical protein